jgi:hypothetical protein
MDHEALDQAVNVLHRAASLTASAADLGAVASLLLIYQDMMAPVLALSDSGLEPPLVFDARWQ